jgi:tRNA-splicing endonuclease subunit Sen34
MAATTSLPTVPEPFPIFKLAHKYLVYDVDTVSYIRRQYNIGGVLIGSLPQAPQQNVFLGLPVELMPEEARLLVEKGVACIVDDAASHKKAFLGNGLSVEERMAYQAALRKQGVTAAKDASKKGNDRKRSALAKKAESEDWNDIPEDMLKPIIDRKPDDSTASAEGDANVSNKTTDESLFIPTPSSSPSPGISTAATVPGRQPYIISPTTSYPPLQAPVSLPVDTGSVVETLPSYPLYKHLHDQGYFLSPGLRFGCQYVAYPGDPLRFHSHFLCNGMDWDQEFDLLDLVGGGRLGTGVKKGFLIGGSGEGGRAADGAYEPRGDIRSFCIEWGGM